jgi:hypothetical protein
MVASKTTYIKTLRDWRSCSPLPSSTPRPCPKRRTCGRPSSGMW